MSRGLRALKESLWDVNIEGFRKALRRSPQQCCTGEVSLCSSHAAQSLQPGSDSTSCPQFVSDGQALYILGTGARLIVLCDSQARVHPTVATHYCQLPNH